MRCTGKKLNGLEKTLTNYGNMRKYIRVRDLGSKGSIGGIKTLAIFMPLLFGEGTEIDFVEFKIIMVLG